MEIINCPQCNKKLEGYSIDHANYLLMQHELTHKRRKMFLQKKQKEDKNVANKVEPKK